MIMANLKVGRQQFTRSLVSSFLHLALFIIPVCAYCQSSWLIGTSGVAIGSSTIIQIDSANFWLLQRVKSGQPNSEYNILHISVFDECGYSESFEITGPQIFDFSSIISAWVDGDTIRIATSINPLIIYYHTIPAVVAVHRTDYGARMSYMMADNVNHLLTIKPLGDGKFLTYHFLSYTDRPTKYACYITDKYLRIEKAFTNFNEYTITGGATPVAEGFVFATSKSLVKLDKDFTNIWARHLPDGFYMSNFHAVSDGFIAVIRDRKRMHLALIKMSNAGEVIWISHNLLPEGTQYLKTASLINEHDKIYAALWYNDPAIPEGNFVQFYEIDPLNGNILTLQQSPPLPPSLSLQQLIKDDFGNLYLLSNTNIDLSGLININHSDECNLTPGGTTSSMPELRFDIDPTPYTSNPDHLWYGNTTLTTYVSTSDVGKICSVEDYDDWLPDTDTLCDGESVTFDLSGIHYPILWDDGYEDKFRTITQPGHYGFRINHCQINHYEAIDIIPGKCGAIFLPNSFTPDGNGINDSWQVFHSTDVKIVKIQIYNRWGAKVYECKGEDCAWNGSIRNQRAAVGVYVVKVDYKDLKGWKVKYGTVTVLE